MEIMSMLIYLLILFVALIVLGCRRNIRCISHVQASIIIAVLVIIFIIAPVNAELEIVLDKLSPQPIEPGEDLAVSIMLVNENSDVSGVMLTILPDSPIKLKNEDNRIIDEGRIIKYGAKAETYLLYIDPRAASGSYDIEFRARWLSNDMPRETNKTFKVMVRGVPQLAISNITLDPGSISPKDTFNITLSVSNEGTGIAREVQVSAATGDLPFVPVGADTNIIKELDPGESSQLSYSVLVKDKAEISSYSIPIKLDYKDENGRNISSQNFVGIRVLGRGELAISDIKIDPQNPVQGDPVTVTMRIENSGNGDAKSVKVSFNIPFEGTKTAFLGKIKPDDDAPAVFSVFANQSGDVPYSAVIEYEDDLGIHSTAEALNLYVPSVNKSNFVSPVSAVVIMVCACVYYLYRRKK